MSTSRKWLILAAFVPSHSGGAVLDFHQLPYMYPSANMSANTSNYTDEFLDRQYNLKRQRKILTVDSSMLKCPMVSVHRNTVRIRGGPAAVIGWAFETGFLPATVELSSMGRLQTLTTVSQKTC